MKQAVGEERTLVGTIFEGSWDKGRKHGRGVRKMIFGSVDEQVGGRVTGVCVCMVSIVLHVCHKEQNLQRVIRFR